MKLEELLKLKAGTVLQKGNRKRIYLGWEGMFIYYKTPSSPKSMKGEFIGHFKKWLEKAEIVETN